MSYSESDDEKDRNLAIKINQELSVIILHISYFLDYVPIFIFSTESNDQINSEGYLN